MWLAAGMVLPFIAWGSGDNSEISENRSEAVGNTGNRICAITSMTAWELRIKNGIKGKNGKTDDTLNGRAEGVRRLLPLFRHEN